MHPAASVAIHACCDLENVGDKQGIDEQRKTIGDELLGCNVEMCGKIVGEGKEVSIECDNRRIRILSLLGEKIRCMKCPREHVDDTQAYIDVEGQEGCNSKRPHGRQYAVKSFHGFLGHGKIYGGIRVDLLC